MSSQSVAIFRSWKSYTLAVVAAGVIAAVCWTISHSHEYTLAPGIFEKHVTRSSVGFRIICVDLRQARIDLKWRDEDARRFGTLAVAMEKVGERAVFATNAGIFDKSFTPLGLHIERGRELHAINLDAGVGNFFWKPNAIFGIRSGEAFLVRSESFTADAGVELASQSGPMLIEHGAILPEVAASTSSKRTRSGVGITAAGEVVFILSIEPCSFAAFANMFSTLNCTDAMYLDGEISRLYTRDSPDDGEFAAIWIVSSR